jgi:RimJ/RimL family protein N-acetyltransferase
MRPDTSFARIETPRLVLRRSRIDDAAMIATYRNDPEVSRYQGWERTDLEGVRESIAEMTDRAPGEPGWVQFSVEERDTGRLIGDVGISAGDEEIEGGENVIKLGYTMSPASQGKGYATEAVRALVDYAFETLGADVVRAFASAENVPSHRVAEKAGLKLVERFEGREDDGTVWRGVRFELHRDERGASPRDT